MFYLTILSTDQNQIDEKRISTHYANLQKATKLGPLESRAEGFTQSFYELGNGQAYLERKIGRGFTIKDGAIDNLEHHPDDQISVIDVGPDSIVIHADKFGVRPVFFGSNSSGTAVGVSSDAHALAISLGLHTINENSILEMLRYGHCVGRESTIFGISRMWPQEVLTLEIRNGEALCNLSKSDIDMYYGSDKSDLEYRLEHAFKSLKAGVRNILKDSRNIACQISGGLDSRITLGLLTSDSAGVVKSLHVGLSNIEEIRIAEQVAFKLRTDHQTLIPPEPSWELFNRGWILTSGQVSGLSASGNLTCHDFLSQHNLRFLIGGWPGDCLIGSYIPNEYIFLTKFFRKVALRSWEIRRGYSLIELGRLSGARTLSRDIPRTRRRLRQILSENEFSTATHQISWWAMFRRQPAFSYISPANLSTKVFEITPLLTKPYLDVLLNLTPREIINKNFYRKLIWNNFPDLRSIPYHATGLPIHPEEIIPSRKFEIKKLIQALVCHEYFELLHLIVKNATSKPIPVANSLETTSWLRLFSQESHDGIEISGKSFKPWKVRDPELRAHFLGVLLAAKKSENYLCSFKQ